MNRRSLLPILKPLSTATVNRLVVLTAAALFASCSEKPASSPDSTSTTDTDVTHVAPRPPESPTSVAPAPNDTTVDGTTSSTNDATTDSTNTLDTSEPSDTMASTGDGSGATVDGIRCSDSVNTGSVCNPDMDSATCDLTSQTCTCSAANTWTCTPSFDTTSTADDTSTEPGASTTGMTDNTATTSHDAGGDTSDPGNVPPEWLPSWATTMQRTEDSNEPPPLGGKTLRQFIWPSYSGNEVRIQLSNERGEAAVELTKVHIAHARPLGQGQIDVASDAQFTWNGSPSVTIPLGATAWSDPLSFELVEMQPTAITMHFASAPSDVTGHPGARTTSYIANGDVVSEVAVSGETRDRWYFINAIEVMAPADAYAVAVLGDSITDGYGVLNEFARWPDFLNVAINSNPMIADKVSVLNFGMGANSLTVGNQDMDPGVERFERDVLGRANKIRWLIVLIGVNDIIASNGNMLDSDGVVNAVTGAYQEIIEKSHGAGILVYGSPITPFASHTQGTALDVRSGVNMWITTSNAFDAIVDLSAAVADPSNSAQLAPQFSNDGLHPNTAGYEAMGKAVDLSLFYNTMQ